MSKVGVVERAFELAPQCGSIRELERLLAQDGYSDVAAHLSGRQIRTRLRDCLDPALKASFDNRIRGYRDRGKAGGQ